jgi:hypothetical protein
LEQHVARGAVVKKTKLTDEFTIDDFQDMYGEAAVVLFVLDGTKNITVCTADKPPKFRSGQTLIALVPGDAVREEE